MFKRYEIERYVEKHPRNVKKATVLAFVVRRSGIVEVGFNRRKASYHTRHGYRFTFHAEYDALVKSGVRAKGAFLYVLRIRRDGSFATAKPCRGCQYHINRAGIVGVVDLFEELKNGGRAKVV